MGYFPKVPFLSSFVESQTTRGAFSVYCLLCCVFTYCILGFWLAEHIYIPKNIKYLFWQILKVDSFQQVYSHLYFTLKSKHALNFDDVFVASRSISIVPIFHTWMPFDKCRSIGVHVVSKCSWIRRCVFYKSFDVSKIVYDWK